MGVIKWTAIVLGLTMTWAGAQRVSATTLPSKSVLTLEAAKRVGAAAEAEAEEGVALPLSSLSSTMAATCCISSG